MAQKLGSGDFERADVEVKQSTLEARHLFFEALSKKNVWASDLLRLFNPDELPEEYLKNNQIETLNALFLLQLSGQSPHKVIEGDIIDTPLFNYFAFLSDKEGQIQDLENDLNFQEKNILQSSTSLRTKSIKEIVPKWKELEFNAEAKPLCRSLKEWAQKYNLYESWFMDFVLEILAEFKSRLDSRINSITKMNPEQLNLIYNKDVSGTIEQSISDYSLKVWKNTLHFAFDNLDKIPPFIYSWRHFKLPPIKWLIDVDLRKKFTDVAIKHLELTIFELRDIKRKSHSSEDKDYDLEQLNKALKSLETFTKAHFEKELTKYCNQVQIMRSKKNYIPVPQKYSKNKHFEWLVEYLIVPDKTFTEIAKENNIDRKSVSEAIYTLAEILEISVKKPVIRGRPKRSKNSEKSRRQLRLL